MRVFLLFACNLLFTCANSQVAEDIYPINPYYRKVQYALLPEPELNRKGVVFYFCDIVYINEFIRNVAEAVFEKTKDDYSYTKYKGDRHRYRNYRLLTGAISYGSKAPFTGFSDTISIFIIADKHKHSFSWKRFRVQNRLVSVDTVYKGVVSSNFSFAPSLGTLHHLIFSQLRVVLKEDDVIVYEKEVEVRAFPSLLQKLPMNFNEPLVKNTGFLKPIDSMNVYIKFEKDYRSVLLYFPF